MDKAICLADEVRILADWLQYDILSVTGGDFETKNSLLAFMIHELKRREHLCSYRIRPVRRRLENQGDDLLKFAARTDQQLAKLAEELEVSPSLVRAVFELQATSKTDSSYWQKRAALQCNLSHKFYMIEQSVQEIAKDTVRASSIVENLNSRLRVYFFLRKTIGPEYLELLQFYLNHHRFARSARSERVGKSPRELLTGQAHAHWSEPLGCQPFRRSLDPQQHTADLRNAA